MRREHIIVCGESFDGNNADESEAPDYLCETSCRYIEELESRVGTEITFLKRDRHLWKAKWKFQVKAKQTMYGRLHARLDARDAMIERLWTIMYRLTYGVYGPNNWHTQAVQAKDISGLESHLNLKQPGTKED